MNGVMGSVLGDAIESIEGGIDIRVLLAESMHMGDEGHNRNKSGSILYIQPDWLLPLLVLQKTVMLRQKSFNSWEIRFVCVERDNGSLKSDG